MKHYLYHPESDCYFMEEVQTIVESCILNGCDELTKEQYFQKLKQQEKTMSEGMFDFSGVTLESGDDFTESGAKPIPAEGWGTFFIIDNKQVNGNLIYTLQNKTQQEASIYLGFAGNEQWQKDQAKATLGKLMQVCGIKGSGPGGSFAMTDIVKFHGMQLDVKIKHHEKMKDGKTYNNANGANYAKARTEAGSGTGTARENSPNPAGEKKGKIAFGAD